MKFHLDPPVRTPVNRIHYNDKILLTGSCFTENIGNELQRRKFQILMNPNGILFDPLSITGGISDAIQLKNYTTEDLVQREGIWYSWKHHGKIANSDQHALLNNINESVKASHDFLKQANWVIITFGTAYSYQLIDKNYMPVANCHKVPGSSFSKKLLSIEEIQTAMDNCFHQLRNFNPKVNIILTVSPVRHIRDGIIENNRSKARLLEAVHHLEEKFNHVYYFPAYEIIIDVLRDYRFYDKDLVHPNLQATNYVFQQFLQSYFDEETREFAEEMQAVLSASTHKPMHRESAEYRKFIQYTMDKIRNLEEKYPEVDFSIEKEKFRLA